MIITILKDQAARPYLRNACTCELYPVGVDTVNNMYN